MKPRFKESGEPEIEALLADLGAWVAHTREWEAAFYCAFGPELFDREFLCVDWERRSVPEAIE